ncbi:MAG: phosphatidylserine decarboxylase [Thermoanaerobaculum sp.]|nr:phosphatidylserine decarboxylase [Thermoanaerobaculum sp.]MDW7967071.1 phosphatidylserine decarboxylase [Thermoanaerobaculum sp.]
MPVHREGFPYIAWSALLGLASFLFGYPWVAALFLLPILAFAAFFRNPPRSSSAPPWVVVAPADGKVIEVGEPPDWIKDKGLHRALSIFMSPADVHVNRAPFAGTVVEALWRPGKKWPAFRPKASELNEHSFVLLQTAFGPVAYRQIAGALARRVVCEVKPGMCLGRGEPVGIIKFSSRVELYLPAQAQLLVTVGDRTKAGETPVAVFPEGSSG